MTINLEGVKTLVCIGDESAMLDLVRLILSRKNLEVVGASTGREGLEIVRRIKPDFVLINLMMTNMDGWEVYRQIKADKTIQHIPVVVITAKTTKIDELLSRHLR